MLMALHMSAYRFAVDAATEGYYTYQVENGEAIITGSNSSISGEVTIPSKLGGYPVTSIADTAFYNCRQLTGITIGSSVKSIGDRAFHACAALKSITIADSVINIGDWAFYDTAYYNDANNWVDDVLYISNHLIKVNPTISGNYTIKKGTKTIADYAFYNTSSSNLTSVIIPDSLVSIGYWAFNGSTSLENITVDKNNNYYSDVDGVLLNKDKTKLIRYPQSKALDTYIMPNSVIDIADAAFLECRNFTSITIGNNVKSIGESAFGECDSLISATLPDGVIIIGGGAFARCDNLVSVTIPDSVTSMGDYVFGGSKKLESINVDVNNGYYCSDDGVLFNKAKTLLIRYPQGKTNKTYTIPDSVVTIATEAFANSHNLTSVTIPNSVKTIETAAFFQCDGLKNIAIPGSVETLYDGVLSSCSSLTNVVINEGVEYIYKKAFYNCVNLERITIPSSIKRIDSWVFYGCSRLTDVWYMGSEEERKNTNIHSDMNHNLLSATWHYNSCIERENHTYDYDCDKECNVCGKKRNTGHVYDDENDIICNICGAEKPPYISGDINDDKSINNKDLGLLMQYLNNWNVEIVAETADVNGDDAVNNKDYGLLMQYLNNWDVELK